MVEVLGFGFGVWDSGFGVEVSGCGVWGLDRSKEPEERSTTRIRPFPAEVGIEVEGFGFRVSGFRV